jgi:hypothetical protein
VIKFRAAYTVVYFSCRKFADLLLSGSFLRRGFLEDFR